MANATWNGSGDSYWTTPSNWSTDSVPTSTAYFSNTGTSQVNFNDTESATIETVHFDENAQQYSINFTSQVMYPSLTITGGVVNNSGKTQTFNVATSSSGFIDQPSLVFEGDDSVTAGDETVQYLAGPVTPDDFGGGVIKFTGTTTAGSAQFIVRTGKGADPSPDHSTVGAEIAFVDSASAATCSITTYGSIGTTMKKGKEVAIDGDTFANAVFHNNSVGASATFTAKGGTIDEGDGGNTQFFDYSNAQNATFHNEGAICSGGNGGDVAMDGNATCGNAVSHNYPATVNGGHGGVISFNNNPNGLHIENPGCYAGNAVINNYGADTDAPGGGGHANFSAKYGSPTADQCTINNYGTKIETSSASNAGHTYFTTSNTGSEVYAPTAGNATILNFAGEVAGAQGGYTEFAVFADSVDFKYGFHIPGIPTAGNATIKNYGGEVKGAWGGVTKFKNNSDAGSATLIAYGGSNEGYAGIIEFYDTSTAASATVQLENGGELNCAEHLSTLSLGSLKASGSYCTVKLATPNVYAPLLYIENDLFADDKVRLEFYQSTTNYRYELSANTPYLVLTAAPGVTIDATKFYVEGLTGQEWTVQVDSTTNSLYAWFTKPDNDSGSAS